MAYSTGSGDYNALMAAVLAHAVADGWTTSGGNWPISKGGVRGVAWSTRTFAATDYLSGSALPITERVIEISVGNSLANATANAAVAANCVMVRGMQYSITEWFIFSDPANFNYIHVVTRQSNGYDSDIYQHFSFGELDKGGMTYGSVAYASSSARRPYVGVIPGAGTAGSQSYDWNCGLNMNFPAPFCGKNFVNSTYERSAGINTVVFMVNGTTSPLPGAGGWASVDTIQKGDLLLNTLAPDSNGQPSIGSLALNGSQYSFAWGFLAGVVGAHPYSGGVSLGALPFILTNGTGTSAQAIFLGMFPGVRVCSLKTFAPKDEITYAADTWKLMPLLKKTDFSLMQLSSIVSSGETGFAYKKVV